MTTVKFYQDGKRTNPVMVSVANSLNDKQLAALADYFGSLPNRQEDQEIAKPNGTRRDMDRRPGAHFL